MVLGTGEHLKRGSIPQDAPSKPPRNLERSVELLNSQSIETNHMDLSSSVSSSQPDQADSLVSPSLLHQVNVTANEKKEERVAKRKGSATSVNGLGSKTDKVNLEHETANEVEAAVEPGVVTDEEPSKKEAPKEVKSSGTKFEQESASPELSLQSADGGTGTDVASVSPTAKENKIEGSEVTPVYSAGMGLYK